MAAGLDYAEDVRRALWALSITACSGGSEARHDAVAPPPSDAEPIQLGTVTSTGSCDPGTIASTTCEHLVVRCDGDPDLGVGVRVTRPTVARATVVLGSGGGGVGFLGATSAKELGFV